MVASCRAAFGDAEPKLICHQRTPLRFGCKGDGPGEAAHRAFVADEAVAFDVHAKEQRVLVTVGSRVDDAQPVAAGLALGPELLAGAAPEGDEACLQCFAIAFIIEKADHEDFSGSGVLHNAGNEPVHFCEVNLCEINLCFGHHLFLCWSCARNAKSPPVLSPAGSFRILFSMALSSSHADPPARSSRDDGDDDDGGHESASRQKPNL